MEFVSSLTHLRMETRFAVDFKVARRRSGLSQADVAHLLGVSRTRVSKLECGHAAPSAEELAVLSLIYSQSFLALGSAAMPALVQALQTRLQDLPNLESYASGRSVKSQTLNSLSKRLEARSRLYYAD